jgi:hypothetical protein
MKGKILEIPAEKFVDIYRTPQPKTKRTGAKMTLP